MERTSEALNAESRLTDDLKVAAIFASFNRKEVAIECVNRLRAQTRPPDCVIVGDNASTDGSALELRAVDWACLQVIDTGGNLGNAGAVNLAMEAAFSAGMDAVWILDDDSWPRSDALDKLLEGEWDPAVVRHPLQIDPVKGRFTWPLQVVLPNGSVELHTDVSSLPGVDRVQTRGVWTGALVSREVRQKVGEVNAALFIRGEDEEYPWRIEMAGFTWEAMVSSVLDHPGPKELIEWKLFRRRLFLERGLPDWKLYYKVRNMVWLKKRQSGRIGALLVAVAYGLAVVRVEGATSLRVWWVACHDGWRDILGRKEF